jgi:hypothetical protein
MTNRTNTKKLAPGKELLLSPLGWSAGARLVWAAGASTLLWLCVAWALNR